jgi:hypothetical protein
MALLTAMDMRWAVGPSGSATDGVAPPAQPMAPVQLVAPVQPAAPVQVVPVSDSIEAAHRVEPGDGFSTPKKVQSIPHR